MINCMVLDTCVKISMKALLATIQQSMVLQLITIHLGLTITGLYQMKLNINSLCFVIGTLASGVGRIMMRTTTYQQAWKTTLI